MSTEEKESESTIVPAGVLFSVIAIWLLAIPISLFVFTAGEEEPMEVPSVKGVETNNVTVPVSTLSMEETREPEIVLEDIPEENYTLSVCYKDLCRKMSHKEFSPLITNGEVDREKFDIYMKEKIIPFFDNVFNEMVVVKNNHGEFLARKYDEGFDFDTLYFKVNSSFISGIDDIRVDLDAKIVPGTDGKYADKYIEVDNSQQTLYVWMNGKVVREIGLSGPVYGWQVYGVFPIVDKGLSPIAPGGKYMPYWMAFYYSKKQDSWYGLHALIWMYRADGSKWYEPESNIRTRQSAGCIRMVLEDAKYLYENFERGDKVLIHE